MVLLDTILKRWPLVALVVSAAALAIVHAAQSFGGLAPCHLCLEQRQVYWWAMGVAAVAVAVTLTRFRAPAPRIAGLVLAALFAYGAYLAAFHAGAEWKWWPAPETCSSTGPVGMAAVQALMAGGGAPTPKCDVAAWRMFGLSMAGYNFLVSLALAGFSLAAALRKGDRPV
jgi:disulfide bond formation protein DsbB